jgi:hypothetical protein
MKRAPEVTQPIDDLAKLKTVVVKIHEYCIFRGWIKPRNLSAMSSFSDAKKVLSDLTHELTNAIIPALSIQAAIDFQTMSNFIISLLRNIRTK